MFGRVSHTDKSTVCTAVWIPHDQRSFSFVMDVIIIFLSFPEWVSRHALCVHCHLPTPLYSTFFVHYFCYKREFPCSRVSHWHLQKLYGNKIHLLNMKLINCLLLRKETPTNCNPFKEPVFSTGQCKDMVALLTILYPESDWLPRNGLHCFTAEILR